MPAACVGSCEIACRLCLPQSQRQSDLCAGGVPQRPPRQLREQRAVEGKKYSYDSMGNITWNNINKKSKYFKN